VRTKIPVVLWFRVYHSDHQWNENTIHLNSDSRRFLHDSMGRKKRINYFGHFNLKINIFN